MKKMYPLLYNNLLYNDLMFHFAIKVLDVNLINL